jgi:methylase of polypeptide subunit release factors
MPTRAEEARARLAAARSATAEAEQSQEDRLAELERRMEGPCDSEDEDDETLEQYAERRLQLAKLPAVELSAEELNAVYEPSDDTFLLLDALEADRERLTAAAPALCMEIGCGTGAVITSLSALLPDSRCIALDINESALAVARRTAALNGRASAVEFVRGDLLSAFRCFEYRREPSLIDVLVFNPPYVPSEPDEIGAN